MPVVGVLLAGVVGDTLGNAARIIGGLLLALFGVYLLRSGDGGAERATPVGTSALLLAGFAVAIDEVAVGISLGLSGISLPVLIGTIALIVFAATMAGLSLGTILARHAERAGNVAAWILILLGALIALGLL